MNSQKRYFFFGQLHLKNLNAILSQLRFAIYLSLCFKLLLIDFENLVLSLQFYLSLLLLIFST
jgi:hypothetical protein